MKKTILKSIFIFIFAIICTFNVKADGLQYTRIQGADRYETNEKIVQQGWQTSEYAVIVNGENYPDALSASVLAKKYNAPIILSCNIATDPKYSNLYPSTVNELKRLNVKKAFIIGGTGVLSNGVENKIKDLGIVTERLYGADRYLTSMAVANKIGTSNGVIVSTGSDFTDALSISSIAGKLQIPIILMPKDSVPSSVSKFIAETNISKTYILGDSSIISDNVVSKFPNAQRIVGSDKYIRNLNIINTFSNNVDFSNVVLASGQNFPDALSGSALAALNGNPILLVGDASKYPYIEDILTTKEIKNIYVLGGQGSISNNTLNDIKGETSKGTLTIIQAMNLVKAKVKLDNNESFGFPFEKSQRITIHNGVKCYCITKDYNETNDVNNKVEICEYLVNINTGEITECNQGQYTQIK